MVMGACRDVVIVVVVVIIIVVIARWIPKIKSVSQSIRK